MTNPRQRRKIRGGKTSRRSRGSNLRNLNLGSSVIKECWKPENTVKENYEQIGLAIRVNEDVGSRKLLRRVQAWDKYRDQVLTTVAEQRQAAELKASEEGTLCMLPMDLGEEEIFSELNAVFQRDEKATEPTAAVAALEALANEPKLKGVRPLNSDDTEYISMLHDKYGKDCIRMARDIKLNNLQKTPAQLQRMLNTFTLMLKHA